MYQDLALCDDLDVVASLFLGREEIDPISRAMDEERMERRALEVLRALNVNIPVVRAPIAALSGGQRVFQVSDRIVVLRLGQLAGTFDTRAASREQVVGRITGADVAEPRRAG